MCDAFEHAIGQVMEDFEIRMQELDLARNFDGSDVGRALADEALSLFRNVADEDGRHRVTEVAQDAGAFARLVFSGSAYDRRASMDEWFSLPEIGVVELASRMRALRRAWLSSDDLTAEEERAAELADEREDSGYYGRTLPYDAGSDQWIYIRFGGMPSEGLSRFGLAREDNEDGMDEWRRELGGMTHESGVSVFRAYRHPSVPDAYVLLEPTFELARYGVGSQIDHLLAVMGDPDKETKAIKLDGRLKTIKARDGSTRVELGSDGEYLVDARQPYAVAEIGVDRLWTSERASVVQLLERAGRRVSSAAANAASSPSAR